MADRNFQKKKRNDVKRKRKPVMLITAEGRNKTEKQYFTSFQDQHGKYYRIGDRSSWYVKGDGEGLEEK